MNISLQSNYCVRMSVRTLLNYIAKPSVSDACLGTRGDVTSRSGPNSLNES